jgi:ribosomal protein S18 acetylase RimI-like enzyme
MSLIIRTGTASDTDALVQQFQALNTYEDAITGDRRTDRAGAVASYEAACQRALGSGGTVLVAERGGELVGFLLVSVEEDPLFVRAELRSHAHISDLYVEAHERRSGIAAALIGEAERYALAHGLTRLTVNVLAGNAGAQTAYQRLGFTPQNVELSKVLVPAK